MAEITASMVKELREKTDAPMMECKKALTEANGDLAKAEEILRVRLGNKASKAASRVAAEGVVGDLHRAGRQARGHHRGQLRDRLRGQERGLPRFRAQPGRAGGQASNPADVAALSALPLGGVERRAGPHGAGGQDRREHVDPPLRAHRRPRASCRATCTAAPRSACWWTSVGGDEALAKDLAMHIAASKPVALSRERVSGRADPEGARHRRPEGGSSRASRPTSSRRWSRAACRNSSRKSRCSASPS